MFPWHSSSRGWTVALAILIWPTAFAFWFSFFVLCAMIPVLGWMALKPMLGVFRLTDLGPRPGDVRLQRVRVL